MPHRHRDRRRGYRRGLLLGFTMSEVMLLLVLALLLSLGVVIKKLAADVQQARADLESSKEAADRGRKCAESLMEVERTLVGSTGNKFDEWFSELRLVTEKAKKWDRVANAVPGLADDPGSIEQLAACVTPDGKETDEGTSTDPCPQDLEQCRQKQADAEKQVAHWMERARAYAGRGGLDYPPCWPDEAGKPIYLFEIVIHDGGLSVRDIAPEERRKEMEGFALGAELSGALQSAAVFESRTRVIAEHGRQANCRHFVRVIDRTTTKDAYKTQLRAIERHFYKFEPAS